MTAYPVGDDVFLAGLMLSDGSDPNIPDAGQQVYMIVRKNQDETAVAVAVNDMETLKEIYRQMSQEPD